MNKEITIYKARVPGVHDHASIKNTNANYLKKIIVL